MPLHRTSPIGVSLLTLCLTACAAEPDRADAMVEPVFDFETTRTVRFTVNVGEPHARVEVSGETASGASSGELYFRGMSDRDGAVVGSLRLPWSINHVDLVVNKPGYTGPFTDESLREYSGPFAPSSRVTVPIADLDGSSIALEVE